MMKFMSRAGIVLVALLALGLWAQMGREDAAAYAAAESCATCHAKIWETYRKTGMGRSFYAPAAGNVAEGTYYHAPSEGHFTVLRRDGKYYQRRHQTGADGKETNVFEKRIDFVLGSGNHARTYLHRTERNTLIELPLGWYAEKNGYLAMNPGYDRPDHEGFRRKVSYDCMYCHNGYPKIPAGHERPFAEPVYLDPLPGGIDCQRCHGPGQNHVQLAGKGGAKIEEIRRAIVNPARLSAERREEVCIQCHLETTSFPLPNSLPRYDKGPFAYRPGEPLSDYWLFFDHAASAGRQDKFEIVNAVYRVRQSRCFLESKGALTCTTCHNPHDAPRGAAATRHYDAACRKCHGAGFEKLVAAGKHTRAGGCADCHMPKRRTEDVVHAVATDHLIQRRKPAADLLAERAERHETGAAAYRGEVALYYPKSLPAGGENDLYLALAQTIEQSNLRAGMRQMTAGLRAQPEARAEFWLAMAEAWRNVGEPGKAVPIYREAMRRDPRMFGVRAKLGAALRKSGQAAEAVAVLRESAGNDAAAWHELGMAYQAQGKVREAMGALEKAIELDPEMVEAHSNLGILAMEAGDAARAAKELREAVRIQPDFADARNNLGNLLAGTGDMAGARAEFEAAVRLRPRDATVRYNYAMALGRARLFDEAQKQLEEALRVNGELAEAHQVLADMLMAKQQVAAALGHYREAVRLRPDSGPALLGLGATLAMTGDLAGATVYLQKAESVGDAGVKQNAAELLRQVEATKRR